MRKDGKILLGPKNCYARWELGFACTCLAGSKGTQSSSPRSSQPSVYHSEALRGISRTIETKDATYSVSNIRLPHNQVTVLNINPFITANGTQDPMVTRLDSKSVIKLLSNLSQSSVSSMLLWGAQRSIFVSC